MSFETIGSRSDNLGDHCVFGSVLMVVGGLDKLVLRISLDVIMRLFAHLVNNIFL